MRWRTTGWAAILAAAVALTGPSGLADAAGSARSAGSVGTARAADDDGHPYGFAQTARPVPGAPDTTDAAPLEPGGTYTSTLPASGSAYYRLDLDADAGAYVSATAVPDPAVPVTASEGIRVSVQDTDGRSCSSFDNATIGAARSPRPLTAWGARETDGTRPRCADAGTYYVVVERVGGSTAAAAPRPWELELAVATEPRPARTDATSAPEAWDSATPAPPTDKPRKRPGGSGFDAAVPVGHGVWTADIEPGQTLFYEVPVDWGQQLYATAELGSASGADRGFTVAALNLALHNPVRALVDDAGTGYDGRQKSAELDPLPPVDFTNRYATADRVSGMRFAGSYYLVVHLAAQVADELGAGPFGLTLRVRVEGAAQEGPLYSGRSVPEGIFEVTEGEREASAAGGTGGAGGTGENGAVLTAVAVGGFGVGTLILMGLGVWTVRGRRAARSWPGGTR
ncbi:hypothetical protein ACWC10_12675 [Streptomyces sp. NPDC001595]|uniref:hypothetical protein n=1 Tax=Streptomyces sp. NPDC001532 TaxID=3154520 RepID=UPI00332B24B7